VEKIKRVKYGPLELDVEAGQARPLREAEVRALKAAASGKSLPQPARRDKSPAGRGERTVARRKARDDRRPERRRGRR
jgi:hypothetical protein